MTPVVAPQIPPAFVWQTLPSPGRSGEASFLVQRLGELRDEGRDTAREVQVRSALRFLQREAGVEDWDGYGARPVDSRAIGQAKLLVDALPWAVPMPSVSADPDGEVSLSWDAASDAVFGVSVRGDGRIAWAGRLADDRTTGIGFLRNGVPAAVLEWASRIGGRLG